MALKNYIRVSLNDIGSLRTYIERERCNRVHEEHLSYANFIFKLAWNDLLVVFNPTKQEICIFTYWGFSG